MNRSTPWGMSDHFKKHGPGVVFYGTPGHGGVRVDATRIEEINIHLSMAASRKWGGDGSLWFEEDLAIAVPIVTWPDYFPGCDIEEAHQNLKDAWPRAYEKAFDVTLTVDDSHALRREAFRRDHAADLIVVSALGIGDGMVRCHAVKGGRLKNGSYPPGEPVRIFIVPKHEYDARSTLGFVIDPERHQEEPVNARA